MDTCKLLKQKLWKHRHVLNYEWDGTIYGGGVIGQRYWEYLKFVDLMELNSESVVLELGGGSPCPRGKEPRPSAKVPKCMLS